MGEIDIQTDVHVFFWLQLETMHPHGGGLRSPTRRAHDEVRLRIELFLSNESRNLKVYRGIVFLGFVLDATMLR